MNVTVPQQKLRIKAIISSKNNSYSNLQLNNSFVGKNVCILKNPKPLYNGDNNETIVRNAVPTGTLYII